MKKYAVIGLGRFGASVAISLAEKGQQVIAIDTDEDLVHDVMDHVTKAVCLDSTDEKAVRSVGVKGVDVAICGIGTNVEASILVTLMLKDIGVPVIICKADSLQHKKALEKIGATRVIMPEKDMGMRLANTLISISDSVIDHVGLSEESSIIELRVPGEFIGKSLRDLAIRADHGLNVIAIKKKLTVNKNGEEVEEETINVNPKADDIVVKGDILVVFGENDKIETLKNKG